MSRSGRDPGERLRTAKKRSTSSARWLTRQLNDPYVKKAKADGYRSRAAYKLIELDEKFDLFKGVERAVDLGHRTGGLESGTAAETPEGEDRRHRPSAHRPHRRRDHLRDGLHGG